ncbi:MAG: 50S ribosomal protein L19 [Rickettsiales bacterium]|nr:50S ribosomal protein L19 [Rickettsiales bacterium]|tara:strand:- start:485 stop:1063 length:579 start_codon:yes stop_codon:yes gene_type:complete
MNNILENFEKDQMQQLMSGKTYPEFNSGDTLKVHLKVKEGEKERIQVFEGVCIAKKNAGVNSSFTVRKISYGEGIERVLPYFSPQISKIEVVKKGDVRRSKLYYLRGRSGKSARIAEKNIYVDNNNLKKNDTNAGIKKTVEVSEKNAKDEKNSLIDSSKKIESLKNDGSEKKETLNKETNKKTANPSLEKKK